MTPPEGIEAEKSPELSQIKNIGEKVADKIGAAVKLGMAVAKASYHIREVPLEFDMRPPWKARIHNWKKVEAPT
jgi:hypothetical protein